MNRTNLVYVCAAAAGTLVFGVVLAGILLEASQMWSEGAAAFFADAGMRLLVGACVALLSAAPYLLLARASRKAGPPMLFAIAAMSMLAFQIWFTIDALWFSQSSTASIGLLFMPLYLLVPAGAVWAIAALAHRVQTKGFPG